MSEVFTMPSANGVEEFRFLLLGKTGTGKSTTGNTILGGELFDSDVSFESVTSECSLKRTQNERRMIEIMDSPGLFDTSKSHEEVTSLVMQAVACMHPGPDAVLYVMKISRYTDEEYGVYTRLKALLDESVTKYLIVVFTHGDSLKGKHIREVLEKAPPRLKAVLEDCNFRYAVMDNINKPQDLIETFFDTVKGLKAENGSKPFVCPKYAYIGGKMEEEVAKRMEAVEKKELENKKHVQQLTASLDQTKELAEKEKAEYERREQEREAALEAHRQKTEDEMRKLSEELKRKNVSEEQQKLQMQQLMTQMQASEQRQREENERQRQAEIKRMEDLMRQKEEFMKQLSAEKDAAAKKMMDEYGAEMTKLKDEISRLEASRNQGGGGGGGFCTIL